MRLVKAAKASHRAKFYSLSTGATQPLSKDEEAVELCRNPTVEPHARMQTAEPKIGRVIDSWRIHGAGMSKGNCS